MPHQHPKSAGRTATSVRLTPDSKGKLADLIKISADQSDAINQAISDSWWLRIGMELEEIKAAADALTDGGKNDPGE